MSYYYWIIDYSFDSTLRIVTGISIDHIIKLFLHMSISGDQITELIPLIGHFPRLRKSHKLQFIERRGLIGAS